MTEEILKEDDILNAADDDPRLDNLPMDDTISEESEEQPEVANTDEPVTTQEENEEETEEVNNDVDEQITNAEDTDDTEEEEEPSEEEPSKETESETSIDYKAAYEQIFSPFKANGRDMQVDNVEDAINLMRMGANYNMKMRDLKPNLKIVKMLQNNDLLDESKLNYLIDLDKKNPEAIKRLIQESKIDPLELDPEEKADYTPNAYTVSDNEVELEQVLENLKDSPVYDTMIDTVGKKWDEPSRQIILQNPDLLYRINEHMNTGIYDQVTAEMEKSRMLGKLRGISDIEAYKTVGDQMAEEGKLIMQESSPNTISPAKEDKPKKADPKLASRKKAASSTNTAPSRSSNNADFNPLNMSDEEFNKMAASLNL